MNNLARKLDFERNGLIQDSSKPQLELFSLEEVTGEESRAKLEVHITPQHLFAGLDNGDYYNLEILGLSGKDSFNGRGVYVTAETVSEGGKEYKVYAAIESREISKLKGYLGNVQLELNIQEENK